MSTAAAAPMKKRPLKAVLLGQKISGGDRKYKLSQ